MKTVNHLLSRLFELAGNVEPSRSIEQWKAAYDLEALSWDHSIDQALMGGVLADRTAYAFASGYLSALSLMFPEQSHDGFSSFCVTEEGGNSPREIKATLTQVDGKWLLKGFKTFVTGGREAEQLFIAVTTGDVIEGRKQIRVVRVLAEQLGVTITELPELPFVPEISHATVRLDNVVVAPSDILPGDGYSDYVKIFRTIEDVHVSMGILGFIARTAITTQWEEHLVEKILSLILANRQIGLMDPRCSMTHLALAGARQQLESLLEQVDAEWEKKDEKGFSFWQRDKPLLKIAGKAGGQRRKNAWVDVSR